MNTDHSPLILAYLDGTISDEELARLNAVLLESADARAQLRSWAAADVRLRELAADAAHAAHAAHAAAVLLGKSESRAGSAKSASWLDRVLLRRWRAPIAAGLAVGAAFTSVVWAYVAPPPAEAMQPVATLVAVSF
jgi:anti-sigma factor RsiW